METLKFYSLGYDTSSSFAWPAILLGVLMLIGAHRGKSIPLIFWYIEATFAGLALLHVPSILSFSLASLPFIVGAALGKVDLVNLQLGKFLAKPKSRRIFTIVFFSLGALINCWVTAHFMYRTVTIEPDALAIESSFGNATVRRDRLQISIGRTGTTGPETWSFLESGTKDSGYVFQNEVFIGSHGQILRGNDVGAVILRWANVQPTFHFY